MKFFILLAERLHHLVDRPLFQYPPGFKSASSVGVFIILFDSSREFFLPYQEWKKWNGMRGYLL